MRLMAIADPRTARVELLVLNWIRSLLWRIRLRVGGASVGRNFRVRGPVKVLLRDGASCRNICIGDDVVFGGRTYIRLRKNGRITIGNGVSTGTEVWFVGANDAELYVGEQTAIGSYCILNGGHGLRLGAHCILAAFVYINSSDHAFARSDLIQRQGFVGAAIEVGDDVWLGGQVYVGKGVSIGQGSVIGAGAVVVRDIAEYKVAVGNPARIVKDRE